MGIDLQLRLLPFGLRCSLVERSPAGIRTSSLGSDGAVELSRLFFRLLLLLHLSCLSLWPLSLADRSCRVGLSIWIDGWPVSAHSVSFIIPHLTSLYKNLQTNKKGRIQIETLLGWLGSREGGLDVAAFWPLLDVGAPVGCCCCCGCCCCFFLSSSSLVAFIYQCVMKKSILKTSEIKHMYRSARVTRPAL